MTGRDPRNLPTTTTSLPTINRLRHVVLVPLNTAPLKAIEEHLGMGVITDEAINKELQGIKNMGARGAAVC